MPIFQPTFNHLQLFWAKNYSESSRKATEDPNINPFLATVMFFRSLLLLAQQRRHYNDSNRHLEGIIPNDVLHSVPRYHLILWCGLITSVVVSTIFNYEPWQFRKCLWNLIDSQAETRLFFFFPPPQKKCIFDFIANKHHSYYECDIQIINPILFQIEAVFESQKTIKI